MLSLFPSGLIMYVPPCLPSLPHPMLDSLDLFATVFSYEKMWGSG